MKKCECIIHDVEVNDYKRLGELFLKVPVKISNRFYHNVLDCWKKTELEKEEKPKGVKTSDHQPCHCGSTDFLRTGTCHVCLICGSSQGCS